MMNVKKLTAALAFGLLGSVSAMASNSAAYNLTYQGVTFQTVATGRDTMTFSIFNALNATGTGSRGWSGITGLRAFQLEFKDTNVTAATINGSTTGVSTKYGLTSTSLGCTGTTTPGACFAFDPALALTNTMSWNLQFFWKAEDTKDDHEKQKALEDPELYVQFMKDTVQQGSILGDQLDETGHPIVGDLYIDLPDEHIQQAIFDRDRAVDSSSSSSGHPDCVPVSAVPEPETNAMMLMGLGLMGLVARRRKAKAA